MSGRRKKKFIKKHEAMKFHLVHRSQRDPLAADKEASQYVLQPVIDRKFIQKQQQRARKQREAAMAGARDEQEREAIRQQQLELQGQGLSTDEERLLSDLMPEDLLQLGIDPDDEDGALITEEQYKQQQVTDGAHLEDYESKHHGEEDEDGGMYFPDSDDENHDDGSSLPHDYDYTQHLKPITGDGVFMSAADGFSVDRAGGEMVPESEFFAPDELIDTRDPDALIAAAAKRGITLTKDMLGSKYEEDVGLMNRDAVQGDKPLRDLKVTRDFYDALEMDDEEDEAAFEELEDDFVAMAMNDEVVDDDGDDEKKQKQNDDGDDAHDAHDDEEEAEAEAEADDGLTVEERARKRQEAILAAEQLDREEKAARTRTWLDAHFAALMKQYGDEDIGELDRFDPEVQGEVEQVNADVLTEFVTKKKQDKSFMPHEVPLTEEQKYHTMRALEVLAEEEEHDDPDEAIQRMFPRKEKPKWDVQSVLSTLTNTENHPSVITIPRKVKADPTKAIALSRRTGAPIRRRGDADDSDDGEAEEDEEEDEEEEEEEVVNEGAARPKKETKAQKKARKAAMKAAKREKRNRKKLLKNMYKQEGKAVKRQAHLQEQHGTAKVVQRY